MAKTGGVNAVARAVDILRALADSPEPLTLVQIGEDSGLPRSTVHRIVQTLLEANLIAVDRRNGGLRLGPELARLAAVSRIRLVPLIRPFLEQLSGAVDEGASLAVLEGSSVRFLDQALAGHGIRAVSLVGSTFPAHCTANGKALLAALPDRTVRATLSAQLTRLTPRTITDREVLVAELGEIRKTGMAFDLEEHETGICAVGHVVHDAVGNLAAITIAVPAQRFYGREAELAEAMSKTVEHANIALSFP